MDVTAQEWFEQGLEDSEVPVICHGCGLELERSELEEHEIP